MTKWRNLLLGKKIVEYFSGIKTAPIAPLCADGHEFLK